MSLLDKIQTPVYDIVIPSTQKTAKFRPFFVKEERALLAAYESEDPKIMLNTLLAVVENTVEPKSAFGAGLTAYDIEYIFTHVRAKSVGEYSTIVLRCDVCDPEEHPEAKSTVRLDLRKVEIHNPQPGDKGIIELNNRMKIQMKNPSVHDLGSNLVDGKVDKIKAVLSCIDTIFLDDEVWHAHEESPEELEQFVNTLTGKDFAKLEEFTEHAPYARIPVEYKCPVCGLEHNKYIKGLRNFF